VDEARQGFDDAVVPSIVAGVPVQPDSARPGRR
jgi:hypothetical protein